MTAELTTRSVRRRLSIVWSVALLAAVLTAPAVSNGSALGQGIEGATYEFEFADGTVISGSNLPGEAGFTGRQSEADLGLSTTVHVSCSDGFHLDGDDAALAGWGESGAPVQGVDPSPVVRFEIVKYKDGEVHKTCGGPQGAPPPTTTTTTLPPSADADIDIEKFVRVGSGEWLDADEAPGPEAMEGVPVAFRFLVTNTGDVRLRNLTLVDTDFSVPGGEIPATLEAGASFAIEIGPFPAEAGQHENIATVSGVGGGAAAHGYSGARNQYSILLADGRLFEGSSNQGDVDLGLLQKVHISCSDRFGFGDGDPTNDGFGEQGSPIQGKEPPIVAYFITRYSNDGSVKRTCGDWDRFAPQIVTDSDPAHYVGRRPVAAIDLEKATNGMDADEPPGPELLVGAPVTWDYVVTNTGDLDLEGVEVHDDQVGPVCSVPFLAAGDTATCAVGGAASDGLYRNVGRVTATALSGEKVSDEDPSHHTGLRASIDLEKLVNGRDADVAPGAFVRNGSDVRFDFVVTNTGTATLVDIVVSDTIFGDVCTIDSLEPGESTTCTVTRSAEEGQHTNTGTATGTPVDSRGEMITKPVSDTDHGNYFGWRAGVDIEKATNGFDADDPAVDPVPQIPVGAPVVWSYVVTNTGNVQLILVTVTDDVLGAVCVIDALAPGESATCTVEGTATAADGLYRNVGSVAATPADPHGKPLAQKPVLDSDPSHYEPVATALSIRKATNGEDANQPTGPIVPAGDPVEWTYEVFNTGSLAIAGVDVIDSDPGVSPAFVGGDTDGDGLLDPGETWLFRATGIAIAGQYANLGTATGQPVDGAGNPVGDPVQADDPSHYLGVAKVRIGDFVWHDFNGDGLQNDGPTSPLSGVTVRLLDESLGVIATTSTDAGGLYGFEVLPGTYFVEFEPVPGTVFTLRDAGPDGVDSDADPATGRTGALVVTTDDLTIDAGLYIPARLGDFAWHDFDGDGFQDDGPTSPLVGVGVQLLDAGGTVLATTSTDADGEYWFENLRPGTYSVKFIPLPGTVFTVPNAAGDAADSDADPATGVTGPYSLVSGQVEPTVDAGFYIPARLGDFVWEDLDGDGVQDEGEPAVPDVVVGLLDGSGETIDSTVTDGDGLYLFAGLRPGTYAVAFELPSGFGFTLADQGSDDSADSDADPVTGVTGPVVIASGDDNRTVDAGLVRLGGGVDLEKLVGGVDADTAPGPFVEIGEIPPDVTFTFVVTNTGDLPLSDLTVGDDVFGTVCTIDVLPVGASETCTRVVAAQVGQHSNEATAVGQPVDDAGLPVGPPVTDRDPAHYYGWFAGIVIEKATNGVDADTADAAPLIPLGGAVAWSYVVTNTGNVALVDIEVVDDVEGLVCTIAELEPGAFTACTLDATAGTLGLYRNVATAAGTPVDDAGSALGEPVADTDPSHYVAVTSGIAVEKATNGEDADLPTGPEIVEGDAVVWTYEVTVIGELPLANVSLIDSDPAVEPAFLGGDGNGNGLLDPGETWRYSASGVAVVGQYENLATATGVPATGDGEPVGPAVSDTDPSHYLGVALVRIGDFVWHDFNGDGIQNDGPEAPLPGVTVRLLDAAGELLGTTATDVAGRYEFLVAPGGYIVEFVAPEGTVFTTRDAGADDAVDSDAAPATGRSGLVSVSDRDDLTVDAGVFIPTAIGDFVWNDLDADGLQDAGEPGIPDVTVILLDAAGIEIASTVTDADGLYRFVVAPGDYTVVFTAPDGFFPSPSDQGSDDAIDSDADAFTGRADVSVVSGADDLTIDAGFYAQAFLGDRVWEDLDGDGLQDEGEPGIAGVTVRLFDGTGSVEYTMTTTDTDGLYLFGPLPAGDYLIVFETPDGFEPAPANQGADDAVDSDAAVVGGETSVIDLTPGADDRTWDAGYFRPAAIGDFVWEDVDGDGTQGAAEPGVGGVVVELRNALGEVIGTTTTVDGSYLFEGLRPGEYSVGFSAPSGFAFTQADQGTDDAADSDADPATGLTAGYVLTSGQIDRSVDAGLVRLSSGIELEKLVDGDDADTAPGPFVQIGEIPPQLVFTFVVTNTGALPLEEILVGDSVFGTVCTIDLLAPGASEQCQLTVVGTVGQHTNLATATGQPVDDGVPVGEPISDADPANYYGWFTGIDIEKATNGEDADTLDRAPIVLAGQPVVWTYLVTNTGNVDLADVAVVDDAQGAICTIPLLAVGASETCSLEGVAFAVGDGDPYRNVGTASGTPVDDNGAVLGNDVADSDPSHYIGVSGGIAIEKSTNGQDADAPPGPDILEGDPVVWVYQVFATGDVGLAGVVVTDSDGSVTPVFTGGDTDQDGILDPGETWTYQATGLAEAGQYANLGTATGTPVDESGTPIGGSLSDVDPSHYFGLAQVRIGDFVWNDLDGDGVQDVGEPGVSDVLVTLRTAGGAIVATTTTDDAGRYEFVVTPGSYVVEFLAPAGAAFTTPDQGGDDALDSDVDSTGSTGTIVIGEVDNLTIDAGLVFPALIGDRIWEDRNRNGIQDPGEPGVAGVPIDLLDAGGAVVASTSSDADGLYQFEVEPGSYRVRFDTTGFAVTDRDAGSDDAVDSDIDPVSGETGLITVVGGANDPTNDAGVYRLIDLQIDKDAIPDSISEFLEFRYDVTVTNLGPSDATGVVLLDLLPARVPGSDPPYPATSPFAQFPCFGDYDPNGGLAQSCVADSAFQVDAPQFGTPLDALVDPLHPSERGTDEVAPGTGITFPQSVELLSIDAPVGVTCEYFAEIDGVAVNGVRCEVGDLAAAESVTITLNVVANPLDRVRVWNRAYTYSPATIGEDPGVFEENVDRNDPASACAAAEPVFGARGVGCNYVKKNEEISATIDLGVVKTASAGEVRPGEELTYTLDVSNEGPFASIVTHVVDALPAGTEFVAASDGCVHEQGTVDCSLGLMMPGDTAIRTVTVRVLPGTEGTLLNVARVENREDPQLAPVDTNPENDEDDAATLVQPIEGTIGDTVFLDTNGNGTQDDGEAGISGVTLILAGGGALDAATDAEGTYLFTQLPAGTYDVAVDLDSLPPGLVTTTPAAVNVVLAEGEVFLDADFGFRPVAIDLEVAKRVDPAAILVGEQAVFEIVVVNQGPDTATGVVLTDLMPSDLGFVGAAGDGAYDPSTGEWTVGELEAGASATLLLTVAGVEAGAFTNIVEVSAAEQPDVDSTPADGEGDDFAAATVAVSAVLPTTTVAPTSTVAPTTTPPTTTGPETLPRTGFEVGDMAAIGATLLIAGALVVLAVRRREEDPAAE